jgi:hypothetical protein
MDALREADIVARGEALAVAGGWVEGTRIGFP